MSDREIGEATDAVAVCKCGADLRAADADGWLSGLEETFASPNRECAQEDVNADGSREGNTCIDADESDLEFPDDWCERCYTLHVVREARAALHTGDPVAAENAAAPGGGTDA